MLAISLAFGASLIWGAADFLGGLQSRRHALIVVLVAVQAAAVVPVGVVVALSGEPAPHGAALAWALASSVGGGLGIAAFYRALAVGTMSIVAPMGALGAVVPMIGGLVEGERPGAVQAAGVVVALAGVILASREPAGGDSARDPRAGLGLAALAAVGMGVALLGLGRATVEAGPAWAILVARLPQLVVLAIAVAVVRPPLPRTVRGVAPLLALGLLDVTANGLFAVATTEGLLSLVSVVGSIYPAFTVLLARAVLGERVTLLQDLGIAATLAGVVAISAG